MRTHLNFIYYDIIFQLVVLLNCFVADVYIFIYNYRLLVCQLGVAKRASLTRFGPAHMWSGKNRSGRAGPSSRNGSIIITRPV